MRSDSEKLKILPHLAQNAKNQEKALGRYQRIRDEIRAFVEALPEAIIGEKEV